jgi:hypothetical protein
LHRRSAAIVPLATAYSIAEGFDEPASVDLDSHHYRHFYAAYVGLTVAAVSIVSLTWIADHSTQLREPGGQRRVATAACDHVAIVNERPVCRWAARPGRISLAAGWVGVGLIIACVGALALSWIGT